MKANSIKELICFFEEAEVVFLNNSLKVGEQFNDDNRKNAEMSNEAHYLKQKYMEKLKKA